MKVLWFSVTPSLYSNVTNEHGGGGWIGALEKIISSSDKIELGVVFLTDKKENFCVKKNNVVYYPINIKRSFFQKVYDKFTYRKIDPIILDYCSKCIEDFKPDVIQIFGSESCFGLLVNRTHVPIVIHMQGCFPPYNNAQYPPGVSFLSYSFALLSQPKKILGLFLRSHLFNERSDREEYILKHNIYYMGRTQWDKALVRLFSPNASYFYCTEALREKFYQSQRWHLKNNTSFKVVSVGAGHFLKGYDVVLKAAKLLKKYSNINFEWILIGPTISNMRVFEKITRIKCDTVDVKAVGKKNVNELVDILLDANLFVHTSYIDNSSNAICEAQYLGLPIIATNSGGTPSLFGSDYDNTLMVPTNDPYYLASKIIEIAADPIKLSAAANSNLAIAHARHNPIALKNSLVKIYEQIIRK